MSIGVQKQIRDNSTSISDFFHDLYNWEEEQDKEEKRRLMRTKKENEVTPQPTTPQVTPSKNSGPLGTKASTSNAEKKAASKDPEAKPIRRDKIPMPKYYDDWDHFNVDGELQKIEDEAFEEHRTAREERQAAKDRILDELAVNSAGDRKRTTNARPRVKVSVRASGRRIAPVDLATPKKEEANRYMAEGRHREAVVTYSSALDILEKYQPHSEKENSCAKGSENQHGDCAGEETEALKLKVALLANRALAFLKVEDWREAHEDCSEALRFEPDHHKATLRRGFALARLRRWAAAARDLTKAVAADPKDKKALAELQMVRRMLDEHLRDARAHAKAVLCDPTRAQTMPMRRLKVQVQTSGNNETPLATEPEVAKSPEASLPAKEADVKAGLEKNTENESSLTGGPVPAQPSAERRPYVPRSVRMRGRQPTTMAAALDSDPILSSSSTAPGHSRAANSRSATTTSCSGSMQAPPAMNFYTFEGKWIRLKGQLQGRAALLQKVGAAALPTLFRESLDAELVASIVEVLSALLDSESSSGKGDKGKEAAAFVVDVLEALARTQRFDLSVRGLSAQEKEACNAVISKASSLMGSSEHVLAALRDAYAPPPPLPVEPEEYEEDKDKQAYAPPPPLPVEPEEHEEDKDDQAASATTTELATAAELPAAIEPAATIEPAASFSLDDCD